MEGNHAETRPAVQWDDNGEVPGNRDELLRNFRVSCASAKVDEPFDVCTETDETVSPGRCNLFEG